MEERDKKLFARNFDEVMCFPHPRINKESLTAITKKYIKSESQIARFTTMNLSYDNNSAKKNEAMIAATVENYYNANRRKLQCKYKYYEAPAVKLITPESCDLQKSK